MTDPLLDRLADLQARNVSVQSIEASKLFLELLAERDQYKLAAEMNRQTIESMTQYYGSLIEDHQ